MKISLETNFSKESAEQVSEILFQWNCARVGVQDFLDLAVILRDDAGILVGALLGWTRWEWAHIETFWIREDLRNRGYGKRMLIDFERVARERKCQMIDLDTFSFQAPGFYQKCGYQEYGRLDGIGHGIHKCFFKKTLL